jgi:DNA-directed RNA polymerase subunit M/transcription elongation factor TFIIS
MCRGLLQQKEENQRLIGVCSCGFKRTAGINISQEDSLKNSIVGSGVVNENNNLNGSFSKICKKCGFDKAEAYNMTSNESEVTIFRCLKCGHATRQSQGSSKA